MRLHGEETSVSWTEQDQHVNILVEDLTDRSAIPE
jgi:hypothetical protein